MGLETVVEQSAEQVSQRRPGRPRGVPLPEAHRKAIAEAMADGEASRRGWETRRRNRQTWEAEDTVEANENEEQR